MLAGFAFPPVVILGSDLNKHAKAGVVSYLSHVFFLLFLFVSQVSQLVAVSTFWLGRCIAFLLENAKTGFIICVLSEKAESSFCLPKRAGVPF
jgi:hypothetical protein